MKISTKAVLFSAFLLPGAGHIFLKKYVSGSVLIGVAIVSLYVLISNAITRAILIANKVLSGEIQNNLAEIIDQVSKQLTGEQAQLINTVTIVFIGVWLISIIDSYRVGRVQDIAASQTTKKKSQPDSL